MRDLHPDRERITDLLYDYAQCLDEARYRDWLALFADETTYRVMLRLNRERHEPLYLLSEDKPALEARIKGYEQEVLPTTLHLVTNVRVHAAGDGAARAESCFSIYRNGVPRLAGRYEHEVRKQADDWRITSCLVTLDAAPMDDIIQVP